MQWTQGDYLISDDPAQVDLDRVCRLLSDTYWARARTRQVIATSIQNSIPFGLFHAQRQIGFARIITDRVTFAWFADVIIDPDYRGKGLGKWLIQCLLCHPAAQVSLQLLRTKDAHSLYEQNGFVRQDCLTRRPNPDDAWETAGS
jgi:GNAT superfamily N-acetyltransferase